MSVFVQEPITAFRRDMVADDEWRIRVEEVAAEIAHESVVAVGRAARYILGSTYIGTTTNVVRFRGFDVILQASEILR